MAKTFTNPGRNTFTHEQLHKFAYDILDHKASMIDYPEFQIEDLIVGDATEPIPFEEAIKIFWNNDEDCYFNQLYNETMEEFAIFLNDTCTNFGYDKATDMVYFGTPGDLATVDEAWMETVGAMLYDQLKLDYEITLNLEKNN